MNFDGNIRGKVKKSLRLRIPNRNVKKMGISYIVHIFIPIIKKYINKKVILIRNKILNGATKGSNFSDNICVILNQFVIESGQNRFINGKVIERTI